MSQFWNTQLYDNSHDFVAKFGEGIFSWLQPKEGEDILDLGCGTGDLTKKIQEAGAKVIGIDSSGEMIATAKGKFSTIHFQQADATQLPFESTFDAVFSNAVLHWIPEKEKAISNIYKSLRKGGRMVVEFGGKDNNQYMFAALKNSFKKRGYTKNANISYLYYPSIGEYASLLEKQGFRVIRAAHFDRQTPLKGENGMKDCFLMFGDNFFPGIPSNVKYEILEETQAALRATHFKNGAWSADYKRIRIVAIKE